MPCEGENNEKPPVLPVETLVSTQPFVVRRRVAFGDCDPAGVVFTPRFLDPYVTGAMDLFLMFLLGRTKSRIAPFDQIGFPVKALNFVFLQTAKLDQELDLYVSVGAVRRRTFDLQVGALTQSAEVTFQASVTRIAINKSNWKSILLPEALKTKLSLYQEEISHDDM